MGILVGVILVGMGLFSVSAVMFMVLREHQEKEEWYIPPQGDSAQPAPEPNNAEKSRE